MSKYLALHLLTLFAFVVASCTEPKEPLPPQPVTPFQVSFKDRLGNSVFKNEPFQTQVGGESNITLRQCDLYISNIRFVRSDGTFWAEPNSYHLVRMPARGAAEPSFRIATVPAERYAFIEYSFGVDSNSNRSIAQRGDLDPINGMAWDWNTGYRYLVMEGTYKLPPATADSNLVWHIGTAANYRTRRYQVEGKLLSDVNTGGRFTINMESIFQSRHMLPPAQSQNIMFEQTATAKAADNLMEAISLAPLVP
jgi:hypothetical protein